MSAEPQSPETAADDAIRAFALGRAAAISKYGQLLARFGKGELRPDDFAQESLKLAVEEGIRYAQDTATLGTAYIGAVVKMASPDPTPRTAKAAVAAARKRTRAKNKK